MLSTPTPRPARAGPGTRRRCAWSRGASATVGVFRELTGRYPLERFGMTEIGVGATNP
jgi:hypothetical protein